MIRLNMNVRMVEEGIGTVELAERIGTIAYSLSPVSWS